MAGRPAGGGGGAARVGGGGGGAVGCDVGAAVGWAVGGGAIGPGPGGDTLGAPLTSAESTVTETEAQTYRKAFQCREAGALSPYHHAAVVALRELTGRDTEPTAAGWRRLLGMKKGG